MPNLRCTHLPSCIGCGFSTFFRWKIYTKFDQFISGGVKNEKNTIHKYSVHISFYEKRVTYTQTGKTPLSDVYCSHHMVSITVFYYNAASDKSKPFIHILRMCLSPSYFSAIRSTALMFSSQPFFTRVFPTFTNYLSTNQDWMLCKWETQSEPDKDRQRERCWKIIIK